MKVDVKILDKRFKDGTWPLPTYATEGSAGLDLRACIDSDTVIEPGDTLLVKSGLVIHLADKNFAGLIIPRSGLGSKNGIIIANVVGLIDSDYTGELLVSLWNRSKQAYTVKPGERIAQYLIVPVIQAQLNIVENLNETDRGSGGFGSSGTN